MPTKTVIRNSSGARRQPVKASRLSARVLKKEKIHRSKSAAKPKLGNNLSKVDAPARRAVVHVAVATRPPVVDERHAAAVRTFEAGLHLEQRQNFRKAGEIFRKLVSTAPADIAD